jgi:hypothetical protein
MALNSNKLLNSDLDMLTYYKSKTQHLPPIIRKKDLMVTDFQNPLKNFLNHSLSKFKNVSVRTVMTSNKLMNQTTSYFKVQKNDISNSYSNSNNKLHEKHQKENSDRYSKLKEFKSHDNMLNILKVLDNKSYSIKGRMDTNKISNENDEELNRNILSKMQFYNTTMNSKLESEHISPLEDKDIFMNKISINKNLKQSQNVTMNKFYFKGKKIINKYEKDKEHVRNSNLKLLDINFKNIKKNKELQTINFDKTKEKEIYIDAMNYKKYNNYNLTNKFKINRGRSVVFISSEIKFKELKI